MRLRALEPEDLDFLYTLENDQDLWDSSESDAPYSKYILKQYIAQSQSFFTSGELRLIIEICEKDKQPKCIGIVDLTNYAPQSSRAQVGIAILKEYRKQGYAYKAIQLLETLVLRKLNLHSLYAYVSTSNIASYNLFCKCGYSPIALLPEWSFHNGKYEDVHLFHKVLRQNH